MPTEWLKLMLEEIARKEEEARLAHEEEERRCKEAMERERTAADTARREPQTMAG